MAIVRDEVSDRDPYSIPLSDVVSSNWRELLRETGLNIL